MTQHLRYFLLAGFLGVFIIKFGVTIPFALFILGGVMGFHLFEIEALFHYFLENTKPRFSTKLLHQAFTDTEKKPLIAQLVLFPLYVFLALLIITSTGSVVGVSLILGLGLRYVWELLMHRHSEELIHAKYLKNVLANSSPGTVRKVMWSYVVLFTVLSLLVFF